MYSTIDTLFQPIIEKVYIKIVIFVLEKKTIYKYIPENEVSKMSQPLHLSDQSFDQEVIKSDIPVLIDFWAAWCGPCKMIAPIMDEMAQEYEGKAKICKLDVDNNQNTAMQFGIRSIPTLLIFKGGEVVDTIVGAVPKEQIVNKLENHL